MDEKHLIKQLKMFSRIKPDKIWLISVKERLLSQDLPVEAEKPMVWLTNVGSFFSERTNNLAVGFAVFIGVVLISGSLYFDWFGFFQNPQSQQIVVSLKEMQSKLESVNNSLDGLKNFDNKSQALAMTEVVKSTVKENQKMAQKLQTSQAGLSKKALASLGQFAEESGEVADRTVQVQKEIFEQCFSDLKQRSLNVADQGRLKQAETSYQQGNLAEAMVILQQIGQ